MKRIKTVNGYTIYQATTQRDADNYNCEIGNYNIYVAQDIRDYGLTNSYPEWENEDSLAVVLARCNGSSYAVACELAEELSGSTAQDMDLVRQIEARLEAGESLQEVAEDLSRQLDVVFPDEYQWELHVDEAAKDKLYFFDAEDWYAAFPHCTPYCLTWDELQDVACNAVDEFGLTWFECRAHEATPEELDQFGTSEARRDDAALADGPEGDLEDVLDQAMTEPTEYRVHSFYAGMTGYSITCGGKEVYFGYSCDEVVERFGFNPDDLKYDENNNAVVMMGADQDVAEDLPSDDQPNQYLAVITWEDSGKTETSYSIKSPGEIFNRIDMYDCYDEDLSLWLLTPEGPQPCDWHGTWHDPNDPLKMSITLRSTGNILDLAWGTDH